MELKLEFDGLEELANDLKNTIDKYPDMADEVLKESGKKFVKHVKKEYKAKVKKHSGKLTKGMKLGNVQNYGSAASIDFYAENKKNPHFHLIENGHNLVTPKYRKGKRMENGGQIIGWVPGVKLMPKIRQEYGPVWQQDIERAAERMLKEENLL